MDQFVKKIRREVWAIGLLGLALFWTLSLGTYDPRDPSWNSVGVREAAQNACGYFGSFLADAGFQLLGLSAWLLPLFLVFWGVQGFQRASQGRPLLKALLALFGVIVVSTLASTYFPQLSFFKGHVSPGGLLGKAISSLLIPVFNVSGMTLILTTLFLILMILSFEKSLFELIQQPFPRWADSMWRSGFLRLGRGFAWLASSSSQVFARLIEPWRLVLVSQGPLSNSGPQRSSQVPSSDTDLSQRTFFPLKGSQDEGEVGDFPEEKDESREGGFFQKAGLKKRKVVIKARVQRRVENWELPKISLIDDPPETRHRVDEKEIRLKSGLLAEKLAQFSVRGEVVGVKPGPAVTMFEFKPAVDVKISKITELADDLSLALSSESVRIIAPIPGRDVVGIETSNSARETVYLKDLVADDGFWEEDCRLPVALGRQADGEIRIVDLRKMPHLMVAGTTGSGKSVFVVSMLVGLLFKHSPKTMKLILVDPKQVDLAAFSGLPHLIMPPIREAKKAVGALRWAIKEMDKRYRSMSKFGARGLEGFNDIVEELEPEQIKEHELRNEPDSGRPQAETYYFTPQPYIVIVVEEFGDLMAVDKNNVESAVVRLAQMARACGIHLVLAMQSPRKDVVTGLIKTNIPGRASFKVASKMDSRIILDESGAERLLARGDMLFLAPGVSKPQRHHGPFLSEPEIMRVVDDWKEQGEPEYDQLALRAIEGSGGGFDLESGGSEGSEEDKDERYDEILAWAAGQKEISASLLQRKFRLGYPRAARMIEIFEIEGVVGPANGSKPRQVLVKEFFAEP